jgi:Mor family transcriptional regulator
MRIDFRLSQKGETMRNFVLSRARMSDYPGVFAEIVEIFGVDVAARLSQNYGGCAALYIPSKRRKDHPLNALLGDDIAARLCAEFGGLTVEIPRAVAARLEQRNTLILTDCVRGLSQSELAKKYQLTTRTIRKITLPARLDKHHAE